MMSTWQLFSDAGNDFRWEISPSAKPPLRQNHPHSSPPPSIHLPSFHDVLTQGCSRILEDCDNSRSNFDDVNYDAATPMFRTGSGSSVVIKKSSIVKACSVLQDDENFVDFDTGQPSFETKGFSSPMFQTGSGKTVNISSSGLLRAKALLGMDGDNDDCTIQGFEPAKKKFRGVDMSEYEKQSQLDKTQFLNNTGTEDHTPSSKSVFHLKSGPSGTRFVGEDIGKFIQPERSTSTTKLSPFKLMTGGGKPLSLSREALQRARNLLGEPEMDCLSNEADAGTSMFSYLKHDSFEGNFFNKEHKTDSSFQFEQNPNIFVSPMKSSSNMNSSSVFSSAKPDSFDGNFLNKVDKTESSYQLEQNPKIFVSPMKSTPSVQSLENNSETMITGTNLMRKFDAEEDSCKSNGKRSSSCMTKRLQAKRLVSDKLLQHSSTNGAGPGSHSLTMPSGGPLVDITNITGTDAATKKGTTTELKRLGKRSSVSPFKMPRSSKFINPLNCNVSSAPDGLLSRGSEASYSRKRVCSRYPFQHSRLYIKEFFKEPPTYPGLVEHLPDQVRKMNPRTSEKYSFCDESLPVDAESFHHMLVQCGASERHASKEWVTNHYKWIVWKLASYERYYSSKIMTRFLTVANVLEELKYRYEREVNHGQRSAIKRILEGDASPSSLLVLCVSGIDNPNASMAEKSSISRIELTDGWYSVCAQLDPFLSKQLAAGKLFVGQKLRICGAHLNGWNAPVSPLEASPAITLVLHINGTYRASWHERLGFCRGACAPLAFRCIKGDGGLIPRTIVGLFRIYPILYRERLPGGGYIVRSEKMEASLTQFYNQRRSNIIEGITSDFQRGLISSGVEDYCDDEGEKILKMLESSAEPELLMAEMSSKQLTSFSKYQAKVEETRQCNLQKLIENALEDAGLSAREVSPFMRVRVVGLQTKGESKGEIHRDGLVTIWNPTESQKLELVEGQAYIVSGLKPMHSDSTTLYLQARGSSTKWNPLTEKEKESFRPFFKSRKSIALSRLGEISLSSEFDTAVLVLHVGLVYISGQQKRQWVFVTDGSLCESQTEVSTTSLLAISFCSPCTDDDSISPINYNLVGSIIGFCNLVKRAKDHVNQMWVAEATENTTYFLKNDHHYGSHLKDAFGHIKKWEQNSSLIIEKLKEKVLHIIGPKA